MILGPEKPKKQKKSTAKEIKQQKSKRLGHVWKTGSNLVIYEELEQNLDKKPLSIWLQEIEQNREPESTTGKTIRQTGNI